MVIVSRHSVLTRREKHLRYDQVWYDEIIELVTKDFNKLNEEDLVIAVESSIHVCEFQKRFAESKIHERRRCQVEDCETVQTKPKWWTKLKNTSLYSLCLGSAQNVHDEPVLCKNPSDETSEGCESVNSQKLSKGSVLTSNEAEERQGLFGTRGGASEGPLHKFFNSEGLTSRKKLVALISWGLAFIGLLIALSFLTRDFVSSQQGTARTIQYIESDSMNFPKLWFCSAETELPPFTTNSPPFKGPPLLWIDFIKGTNASLNLSYPDTKELSQYSQQVIGVQGNTCNASTKMDPEKYYEENSRRPSCFYCIALERKPAFGVEEGKGGSNLEDYSSRLFVRLSKQAFLSRCRTSQGGLTEGILSFFRAEMKKHSIALEEANILDFGGVDARNSSNDGILWPYYRHGMMNTTVDYNVYDVVDMFCNVYMFSGFFYPTTSDGIQFRFNTVVLRWERNGKGPYYPSSFSHYYKPAEAFADLEDSGTIGQETNENRSVFSGNTMYVMTDTSQIGGAETLVSLEPLGMAKVSFARQEVNGQELMPATVMRSAVETGDIRGINFVYFVDFGFSSFFTRQVTDQQAMPWTAYLADFFGLTSLFLDLSVYTIIVSPISGRREQTPAKRMGSGQEARLSRRGYIAPERD